MSDTATSSALQPVHHLAGGSRLPASGDTVPVHNPATGEIIARTPLGGAAEVDAAVAAAREVFPAWAATPLKERVQVFFRYRSLLDAHRGELSALITEEHGKTGPEAEAEIDKAMELCEFAVSLPQIATGEVLEVSRGIECRLEHFPLGVVALDGPVQRDRGNPDRSQQPGHGAGGVHRHVAGHTSAGGRR